MAMDPSKLPRRVTGHQLLGLLLIIAPLSFVWQVELLLTADEMREHTLIFFVWPVDPVAVYHGLMYVVFAATWPAGILLIRGDLEDSKTG